MTIVPDDKNWTWVLERTCPECGFDASPIERSRVGATIRSMNAAWDAVLRRPTVRDRPSPSMWSPLEYGCHVRDVYRVFDGRLSRMLAEEHPTFANWDQDATAVEDRYGEQDPTIVATELVEAADVLAARFDERRRRPVAPHERAQRRFGVHRRLVRQVSAARPDPPSARCRGAVRRGLALIRIGASPGGCWSRSTGRASVRTDPNRHFTEWASEASRPRWRRGCRRSRIV